MPKVHALGRLHAPDKRDRKHLIRALIEPWAITSGTHYWWQAGLWANQGSKPECVAYSWTHWLCDGPVTNKSYVNQDDLYHQAQLVDEWPGESYEGTSVRAGAKVLQDKALISEYHWAFTLDDMKLAVLNLGPVVCGTNWYSTMFTPDPNGFLKIGDQATIAGGHAWVVNGINTDAGKFRMKNSWGRSWGHQGNAWIDFDTMDRLLNEQGEVALATEIKVR